MAYIKTISYVSDIDKLGIKIMELDYEEYMYDGFRIQINDGDYIEIPKVNSGHKETTTIVIDGLQSATPYNIKGQTCYKNEWKDVIGATFVTSKYTNQYTPVISPYRPMELISEVIVE